MDGDLLRSRADASLSPYVSVLIGQENAYGIVNGDYLGQDLLRFGFSSSIVVNTPYLKQSGFHVIFLIQNRLSNESGQ